MLTLFLRPAVPARRILVAGLVCLATGLSAAGPARADEPEGPEARYFDGLRERRLFGLAEGVLLDRLAQPHHSPERRAEFVLELSRTFAEHARYAAGHESQDFWDRAGRVIEEFFEAHPDTPRRSLLDVQWALVPAGQGHHLRWQVELFPFDDDLRAEAQGALDLAIERLRALEQDFSERHRTASPRRRNRQDSLSPSELRRLRDNVRLHLGAALLDQAHLLPAGSPDRMATLHDAEGVLRQMAGGSGGDPLAWHSLVLLVESSRLRGDLQDAVSAVMQLEAREPPRDALDRLMAQRVQIWLRLGKPDDAAEKLLEYRRRHGRLPGELAYLETTTLAALWEIAREKGDPDLADALLEQVERSVERAVREVGGYWAARCELLFEMARETNDYGVELAAEVRKARGLYRSGNGEEALHAFGRAARQADRAGLAEAAFDLGYMQASIQVELGNYERGAVAFRDLVDRFPGNARTADADLLAAWCLGRLYDETRTETRRVAYTRALEEHRTRFRGDSHFEATWLLAVLEERRLQATRALALYREIPADHPRGPQAQVAVARCYEAVLERIRELRRAAEPDRQEALRRVAGQWEDEAVRSLEPVAAGFGDGPWNAWQAEVALRLARIQLNRESPGYAQADVLLERLFSSGEARREERESPRPGGNEPPEEGTWGAVLKSGTQLRIVSLAGQGQAGQAAALVGTLSETRAAEVLSVLDGLSHLARDVHGPARRDLGELQLRAAEELDRRRAELTPEEQVRLDRCLAQAFAATNQPLRAIEVYESLLARSPRNAELLRTLCDLLRACDTRDCLRKAKEYWRRLESLEKPGSPEWLSARYHVAETALALHEHEECRKLLNVTRLLYPDLGGDALRAKFQRLERELSAARAE